MGRIVDSENRTNDAAVRNKVLQQHLHLIVNASRDLLPDLTAIILYGSFGRDEGSWYQDKQGV